MYLTTLRRRLSELYDTVWRRNLMRSGMVTILILLSVLVGLTAMYRAHMRGNFHKLKLKANIDTAREDAPLPRPGGQDAIVLTRSHLMGESAPELLSATVLPGRGMNVLQITAFIPGRGEVSLLASPSLEDAAKAMTGKGPDSEGQASMAMGGAFEVPWAGNLWGAANGQDSQITAQWQGQTMDLPASGRQASNGLLLARGADSAESETLPDGGNADATFHAQDFGGHWPSKTDVSVSVLLSSHSMDLTVVATNIGDQPEPIGIGWHPRFAFLGDKREQWRIHIPADSRAEVRGRETEQPTGALIPVARTTYDVSAPGGVALGTAGLDACFTGLRQSLLSNGPAAELTDPAGGFGLRLTAMSPTIRAMQVDAPANGAYVSIDPQYNLPDVFGHEWDKDADGGMVVLQPGESTEWKVRLEIFSLSASRPAL